MFYKILLLLLFPLFVNAQEIGGLYGMGIHSTKDVNFSLKTSIFMEYKGVYSSLSVQAPLSNNPSPGVISSLSIGYETFKNFYILTNYGLSTEINTSKWIYGSTVMFKKEISQDNSNGFFIEFNYYAKNNMSGYSGLFIDF